MKTKAERKVNRSIRKLNSSLSKDVFGNRFYARQVKKSRVDGTTFYLIELIDNEEPERNRLCNGWIPACSIYTFNQIWEEMNDFIVNSNFWQKYRKNNTCQ